MFQLTPEEWKVFTNSHISTSHNVDDANSFSDDYNLTSQIVTSRFSDKWGGSRRPPYAFTEIGVAMLSSVLKSEVAIQANRKKIMGSVLLITISSNIVCRRQSY